MNADEVVRLAKDSGVQLVTFMYCDNAEVIRNKSTHVNSYRRLQANSWTSAHSAYGPDNREAAVRIPSALWGRDHESVNLELKPPDSSANPYIALGGAIATTWTASGRRSVHQRIYAPTSTPTRYRGKSERRGGHPGPARATWSRRRRRWQMARC